MRSKFDMVAEFDNPPELADVQHHLDRYAKLTKRPNIINLWQLSRHYKLGETLVPK